MTPIGVRRALTALGWSQREAARQLGKNERTVRRWCEDGAPPHVARALAALKAGTITVALARAYLAETYERRMPSAA